MNRRHHLQSDVILWLKSKHVLVNILRSRYVARTPPMEARSPGRCSNVENAPVDSQSPASQPRNFENAPVTRQSAASSARRPAERSHYVVISRDGRKLQACKLVSRYVAIATQPVHRLQIRPIVHN